MRRSSYIALLGALILHVGGCADDYYTVVGSACETVLQGTTPYYTAGTVWVGEPGSCTGTYIAPTVVLTAEHCHMWDKVGADDVVRNTVSRITHPSADLAILFLDGELPRDYQSLGVADYGLATVQGYGATETGSKGSLLETTVFIEQFWAPDFAVTSSGPDSCYGDSGGPLYQDGTLVGVVKGGLPGHEGTCGRGGTYTVVAKYKNWLDSEVDHLNWVSSCGTL